MFKYHFLICLAACCILACEPNIQKQEPIDANKAYYESIRHMTGLEFQPNIMQADSVEVLFYTNPDGDPGRYTRFYNRVPATDSGLVISMKQSINKHFERLEKVKDCRSEGKIHFFAAGNPVQTVYFSNRGDSCNHLYFIADGWFYYMPMDSSTAVGLRQLKVLSAAPKLGGQE